MALTKTTRRMIDDTVINVKDYGATGDGLTDDTSAIQAAFNAAKNAGYIRRSAANGFIYNNPILYFPQGVYRITDTLDFFFMQGMIIEGAGPEASIILNGSLTTATIHLKDCRDFVIRDLGIQRGTLNTTLSKPYIEGLSGTETGYEIWWTRQSDGNRWGRFENLHFRDCGECFRLENLGTGLSTLSESYYKGIVAVNIKNFFHADQVQMILHQFDSCHIDNHSDNVWYFENGGWLHATACGIQGPGCGLRIASTVQSSGVNQFVLDHIKWEWWRNAVPTATPKGVVIEGDSSEVQVSLRNCGNVAANFPHPTPTFDNDVFFEVQGGNSSLDFDGGTIVGNVKLTASAGVSLYKNHRGGAHFRNMKSCPRANQVKLISVLSGSRYPSVSWEHCTNQPDLWLGNDTFDYSTYPLFSMSVSESGGYIKYPGTATRTFGVDFGDDPDGNAIEVLLEKVILSGRKVTGGTGDGASLAIKDESGATITTQTLAQAQGEVDLVILDGTTLHRINEIVFETASTSDSAMLGAIIIQYRAIPRRAAV